MIPPWGYSGGITELKGAKEQNIRRHQAMTLETGNE
jgi:hypothetical protein